jgi:hypothetical protein
MDLCDWAASHLRSAREGAWRGNLGDLEAHLGLADNALKAAFMTFDALKSEEAKAADAELTSA